MQRQLQLLAAGLVLAVAGLIGPQSAAQSIQWTGHYYIAIGDAAGVPAAIVGTHAGWNDARPITALAGGEFADFAVRPITISELVPDHRYDVLALGSTRLGPVTVSGFESEGSPTFATEAVPIPDVGAPHSILATVDAYLVVASRPPTGPVLSGDYVVAYGTPDKWAIAPGPDFRGGLFADMAVAPTSRVAVDAAPLVAVGSRNEQTVVIRGSLVDGRPYFDAPSELEVIPSMVRPIAIEWAGAYFVVMGVDAEGRTLLVYGRPGAWNDSKTLLSGGVTLSNMAVAPLVSSGDGKPGKRYDLVAIGLFKDMVVTLSGEEWVDTPMLYPDWAEVPGLGGSPSVAGPISAAATSAVAADVGSATPNPFTSRSVLTMTVAREQPVLVEVFDAIGRRVAMLHNGALAAGVEHSFAFDAQGMPSGVYHFRINGVDFSEVRAVTLAR